MPGSSHPAIPTARVERPVPNVDVLRASGVELALHVVTVRGNVYIVEDERTGGADKTEHGSDSPVARAHGAQVVQDQVEVPATPSERVRNSLQMYMCSVLMPSLAK